MRWDTTVKRREGVENVNCHQAALWWWPLYPKYNGRLKTEFMDRVPCFSLWTRIKQSSSFNLKFEFGLTYL